MKKNVTKAIKKNQANVGMFQVKWDKSTKQLLGLQFNRDSVSDAKNSAVFKKAVFSKPNS